MNDPSSTDTSMLLLVLADRLCSEVQRRPVATLAGAAAAGYVLAAGLPDVVVRAGTGLALRALAARVVTELKDAAPRTASTVARPAAPPTASDDLDVQPNRPTDAEQATTAGDKATRRAEA